MRVAARIFGSIGAKCQGCRGIRGFQRIPFSSHAPGSSGLSDYLKSTIQVSGPLTVARYMEEALTNPKWGYYMHRDVFGKKGDFTTSPESSQMFGELIGVWLLSQWMTFGSPKNLQFIEYGPGRGTLMADILRVISQFSGLCDNVTVNLIEVSPHLKGLQRKMLCKEPQVLSAADTNCLTEHGINVCWHASIDDVAPGISFIVAHEFFDALPVHLFKKTDKGWRELLVDYSMEGFHLVVAPGASPLLAAFPPSDDSTAEIEICPAAFKIMNEMSKRVTAHGGCGLIVDYGDVGSYHHSLRAFKDHKLHDVLAEPGSADITANVDFGILRHATESAGLKCFGPVTQRSFLHSMEIQSRLQALLKNATAEQTKSLQSSYHFLTDVEQMGEKFKMFSFGQSDMPQPPGFS